jgi:V/A-type H+-transporting ATPase subunit E
MGYGELISVLREEAAREAQELRAAAERESTRIVDEARAAARAASDALVARERSEAAAGRHAALEALALEQDRIVLGEQRRILDGIRAEVARRLPAPVGPEVLGRLLREVLAEAGEGSVVLEVDPGEEEICRGLLARERANLASRAQVRAAATLRGGVALIDGRRILDDTLPARLERAWPALEPELATILFGGG